jgi:hypothetical protein
VQIHGKEHTISAAPRGSSTLTLIDEENKRVSISRAVLAALLVTQQAELIDDIEVYENDEEAECWRTATNVFALEAHRIVDWFGKLFLVRRMLRMNGSPRSKVYRLQFGQASRELDDWYAAMDISGYSRWSQWTVYHDVLRMRHHRYRLSALQVKGVEYRAQISANEEREALKKRAEEMLLANPSWTVANLHRELKDERTQEMMA